MPILPIGGGGAGLSRGGTGNVIRRRRSIKNTTANLKAYPGNFKLSEVSVDWTDLTTNGFTVSKKTLWAKE